MRRPAWISALLLALLCIGPSAEAGEMPFGSGRHWYGLATGYGYSLRDDGGGSDESEVEYVPILPRWGMGLTDPVGNGRWFRGNVDLVVEGLFMIQVQPRSGFAGGATVGARYNFLAGRAVVPFVEAGIGVAGVDLDLDRFANGVAFPIHVGAGAHVRLSPRAAITAQWRFQHLSNGGIYSDNRSLNDGIVLIGLTVFRP